MMAQDCKNGAVSGSLNSQCGGRPRSHFSPATAPCVSHSVNYLWQTIRKCFFPLHYDPFLPIFLHQAGNGLPHLRPPSPSLLSSRLIHAVAPKHNTLSHWASPTGETCTDSAALSSTLQERSRQTAGWGKKTLWAIIMTPTQPENETVSCVRWINLSPGYPLHSRRAQGRSFIFQEMQDDNIIF